VRTEGEESDYARRFIEGEDGAPYDAVAKRHIGGASVLQLSSFHGELLWIRFQCSEQFRKAWPEYVSL